MGKEASDKSRDQIEEAESISRVKGVIIIGRQHSGNTFLTRIIGTSTDCLVDENENNWFEQLPNIRKEKELYQKVELSMQHLLRNESQRAIRQTEALYNWAKQRPHLEPYHLFSKGLELSTLAAGKSFWALKATSYIFYAKEILDNCPEVKLIYLMRNPLDLTASTKKRNAKGLDWLIATNLAWRKGVAIAQQLATHYPDRFKIVKYEAVVRDQSVLHQIGTFLNVALSENYQNLPVVNTSDRPYQLSEQKGILTSKIYYFPKNLTVGEINWTILLAGGKNHILQLYPDLPLSNNNRILAILRSMPTFIRMSLLFGKKHLNIFSTVTWHRAWRRANLMLSSKFNY